jgi:acetyltransferase-like isoleucine patch superfamily enzyme
MPVESVRPDTVLALQADPAGRVVIKGEATTLRIGAGSIVNAMIWVMPEARNTTIEIGESCVINGMIRIVRGDGGLIQIGDRTTFNDVGLSQHEAGRMIFGRNNMLSAEIRMDVSDMHPIYDRYSGERLNPAKDIHLEDDVWVGVGARLLKGAYIGRGSIIGAGSTVTGKIPPHVLAVGSPARVIREDIAWRREFDQPFEPEPRPEPRLEVEAPRRRWLARLG